MSALDWEAIASISDAIATVAVIASLVYLAIQIRQSNRHAKGAAEVSWMQGLNSIWESWSDSELTIDTLRKGFGGFETLTRNEQAIFHMRVGALVNHWLLAKQLHGKALLSSQVAEQMTDVVVAVLSTKGGLEYWERDAHATPGGTDLLELVKSGEREVPPWDQLLPWWAEEGS